MTPSSGASTRVCASFSSSACSLARSDCMRARDVCSTVRYCWICCALIAPLACSCARALGVGLRLGEHRLRLGDGGARLRHVGGHGLALQTRQRLTALDPIADVDQHIRQAQPADFGADHRLLPGGDVAVGGQHLRPFAALRHGNIDRQCGLGRRGRSGLVVLLVGGSSRKRQHGQPGDRCREQPGSHRACHGLPFDWVVGACGSQPPPIARYSDTQAATRSRCTATSAACAASAMRRASS